MTTTPNVIEKLKPQYCRNYGSDLSKENLVLKYKQQVTDLQLIELIYKECQQFLYECTNCKTQKIESFPFEAKTQIQYESSVKILVGTFIT